MEQRPIPSFTRRGFIVDPIEKVDFILAYFFETLPSQSWLFRSENISVQKLIAQHSGDPMGFITSLSDILKDIFLRYFVNAEVQVSLDNEAEYIVSGRADITVFITVFQDNKNYQVERYLREYDSVFRIVTQQVNYGE